MSLHDAAVLSGQEPIFTDAPEVALRKYCLEMAMGLGDKPANAGELISKAAGIYNWLTKLGKADTGE